MGVLRKILDGVAWAYSWLIHRPYVFLTASDERLGREPPQRFARTWVATMLLSLVWGVFLAWLWGTAWTVFKETPGDYWMRSAAVVSATVLWLYRRSLLALGECLARDVREQALVVCVAVVVLVLVMLGLRRPYDPDWEFFRISDRQINLPPHWQWLFPMVVQRVLILAPLWGAWAALIACQFCKPNDQTEPAVAAFARGCSPLAASASMAVPLALTLVYLNFLGWWRLMIPAMTLLCAILGGLVLGRRTGGLKRRTILAVNILTQIAFILAYLASR